MKEVLMRIFESNPNKENVVIQYTQNQYEHHFGIYVKSNLETLFDFDLSNFQSLKESEQNEVINQIDSALCWYNLQP